MHAEPAGIYAADRAMVSHDQVSPALFAVTAVSLAASLVAAMAGALKAGSGPGFAILAAAVASLLAGSAYYGRVRGDRRLARLFRGGAELLLLTVTIGSLSYVAAALNRPLWDDAFTAWDRRLGFYWPEWLALLNDHPNVHLVLAAAYRSMIPQFFLALAALVAVRKYRATDVYLIAFALSAWVCVGVSALMPALSPLVHFGMVPADYPNITLAVPLEFANQVQALRDGALHITDLGGAQGLVTFPSFHTSSAVVLMLAFWQVPYARWPGVVVNGVMLLSIPVEGSHYIVDVIAGVAVGLGSWAIAQAAQSLGTVSGSSRPPLAHVMCRWNNAASGNRR